MIRVSNTQRKPDPAEDARQARARSKSKARKKDTGRKTSKSKAGKSKASKKGRGCKARKKSTQDLDKGSGKGQDWGADRVASEHQRRHLAQQTF